MSDTSIALEIERFLARLDEFPGPTIMAKKKSKPGDEPEAKDDPDEEQAELDCMPARR